MKKFDPVVVAVLIECASNSDLGKECDPDELFWKFAHWVMLREENERNRPQRYDDMCRLFRMDKKTVVSLNRDRGTMTVSHHHNLLKRKPVCTLPDIVVECAEKLNVNLNSEHSRYLINAGHMLALAGTTVANSHLDPEFCVWCELQNMLDKAKQVYGPFEKNVLAFKRLPWVACVELMTLMTPMNIVETAYFWAHGGDLDREDRKLFNLMVLGGYCMYDDRILVPGLPVIWELIPFVESIEDDLIYLERAKAHAAWRASLSASSRA